VLITGSVTGSPLRGKNRLPVSVLTGSRTIEPVRNRAGVSKCSAVTPWRALPGLPPAAGDSKGFEFPHSGLGGIAGLGNHALANRRRADFGVCTTLHRVEANGGGPSLFVPASLRTAGCSDCCAYGLRTLRRGGDCQGYGQHPARTAVANTHVFAEKEVRFVTPPGGVAECFLERLFATPAGAM
jgi:hypothetical protein